MIFIACSCGATSTDATPSTASTAPGSLGAGADWSSFSSNGVAFRFPKAWRSYPYRASFHTMQVLMQVITYLSSIALPNPCTTNAPSGRPVGTCTRWPSVRLGPHDVLVLWIATSGPDTTGLPDAMRLAPGTPATFGGHAAKVAGGPASSDCGSVGAQYAISAVIARTPPPVHSTVLVTACLGSDESAERAEVMAILATLQVTP